MTDILENEAKCVIPPNTITNDKHSSFFGLVGTEHPVRSVIVDSCFTQCPLPYTPDSCESSYIRGIYECVQGTNANAYWIKTGTKLSRDAFFRGKIPRRFGKRHLCKPTFLDTPQDAVQCGPTPKIVLKKWSSQSTRYDDNLTTIVCAADALPPKSVLNMICHSEPNWDGPKWMYKRSTGKIRPLQETLPSRCEYYLFLNSKIKRILF